MFSLPLEVCVWAEKLPGRIVDVDERRERPKWGSREFDCGRRGRHCYIPALEYMGVDLKVRSEARSEAEYGARQPEYEDFLSTPRVGRIDVGSDVDSNNSNS